MKKWMLLIALTISIIAQAQIKDTSFLARTRGAWTYLNYGLGQDRLGGAKMGMIDSLVLLHVTGQHEDQYRVRLTSSLSAWIPKNLVKKDSTTRQPVQYLSGSWSVRGEGTQDILSMAFPERLPYQSWQEVDPSRIVIDVFGLTANTNWITQMSSVKAIKNVDYEQVADEQFRIKISLKYVQHWGYSVGYVGKRLVIKINHQPPQLKLNALTIALDAGHGGSNLGARGLRTQRYEKELNLMIVQKLKTALEKQGAAVILTRSTDTLIDNSARVLQLRPRRPDLLIIIHNNAAGDTVKVRGTSTYYKHIGYRSLSTAILKRLLTLGVSEYGNVGRFNFTLNTPTEYPNVLVEGLFMSQADDEKLIFDESFQQKMADQIVLGVKDWLKKTRKASKKL